DGRMGLSVHEAWVALEAQLPASISVAQDTVRYHGMDWPRVDSAEELTEELTASTADRHVRRPVSPRSLPSSGLIAVVLVLLLVAVSSGLFYSMRQGRSSSGATSGSSAVSVQLTYHPTHLLTPGEMLPNTFLYDVQMLSSDDGWAVGGTDVVAGNVISTTTAIFHYQHGRWIASPDVVADGVLFSLSMVSPDDGWAAGVLSFAGTNNTRSEAIMLHFDGQHWRRVSIPPHDQINKVKMLSPTEGWAVANDLNLSFPFLHYQSGVWSDVEPAHQAAFFTDFAMVSP